MILIDPMPDEIAAGYDGRLRVLNGWTDRWTSTQELRGALATEGLDHNGPSALYLLASAARIPPTAFARLHTLLPVVNVASDFGAGVPHGSRNCGTGIHYGVKGTGARPRVCHECTQEDLNHWGFSWYRRAHQLHGVDWCDKHGCALSWVDSHDPFCSPPHVWFAQEACYEIADPWTTPCHAPALLQRYAAVCIALLDHEAPASTRSLNPVLARRASAQGLSLALLQANIEDLAPPDWIAQNFPHVRSRTGIGHTTIGRLLRRPGCVAPGPDYALLIALLFDDIDGAMIELFGTQKSASTRAEQASRHGS